MDPCARIREFFARFDGGEFVAYGSDVPYTTIPSKVEPRVAIYCTKPRLLAKAFERSEQPPDVALTGRAGLPADEDRERLGSFFSSGRVRFLGDLDPPDLLIYGWLRSALPQIDWEYVGISDDLLQAADLGADLIDRLPIALQERDAVSELDACLPPTLETLVGAGCAGLLRSQIKIELEALLVPDAASARRTLDRPLA